MIPTEGAEEQKQAMLDEMDRMSRHLWGVVERQQSDDGRGLQAIAQLLRVQERKARLMGLDAPTLRAVDVITSRSTALRTSVIWGGGIATDVVATEATQPRGMAPSLPGGRGTDSGILDWITPDQIAAVVTYVHRRYPLCDLEERGPTSRPASG